MNQIEISVVIPMYNSKETILDALESVTKQTANEFIKEIVIIDDGSVDKSGDIVLEYISKYEGHIDIKYNKKENGGVSSARNLGIKKAKYNWIAFLDSDDVWLPDKIKKQVEILFEFPGIRCLGTGCVNDNATPGKQIKQGLYKMDSKSFLLKYWPHTPSYLMRKEDIEKASSFNDSRKYAEDGEFFIRLLAQQPIYYISEELIECGHGKPMFGAKGLSSNLKGMHRGCVQNIQLAYHLSQINIVERVFLWGIEEMKYVRRIIISLYRKG